MHSRPMHSLQVVAAASLVLILVCPLIVALYLSFGFESNLEGLLVQLEAVRKFREIDATQDAAKVERKNNTAAQGALDDPSNAALDLSDDEAEASQTAAKPKKKKKKRNEKVCSCSCSCCERG